MKRQTSTFHHALECLSHPVTLASIGLLLVNDHFLKAAYPSWLTGKVSDFAGLFFFPFLLAVILAPLLDRARLGVRVQGAIAILLTALGFALIKLTPFGNSVATDLLSFLLQTHVAFVLDPTDLIALVVLWPAWEVWNGPALHWLERRPRVVQWLALSVAAFSALATSACPTADSVRGVAVRDGIVYANVYQNMYANPSSGQMSNDGGTTWQPWKGDSDTSTSRITFDESAQQTVCEPDKPTTCYRIVKGVPEVEETTDGQTWRVAWSIPANRMPVMERIATNAGCGDAKTIDFGPYGIATVPVAGGTRVIVSLGTEGILVRDQKGAWNWRALGTAKPTPYVAENLNEALGVTDFERGLYGVISILGYLCITLVVAYGVAHRLKSSPAYKGKHPRIAVPILILAVLILLMALVTLLLPPAVPGLLIAMLARESALATVSVMGIFIAVLATYIAWDRVRSAGEAPGIIRQAVMWSLVAALAFPLTWGVWLLWAFGIISAAEIAWVVSGIICLVLWAIAFRGMRSASRAAESLPPNPS